jgi:nucleotide-binding universal stress UspA family protein
MQNRGLSSPRGEYILPASRPLAKKSGEVPRQALAAIGGTRSSLGGVMPSETARLFQTILVAHDGSPQAQRAAEIAFSMAEVLQSKLLILAVIRLPEPAPRAELHAVLDDGREHYEKNFAQLREQAKLRGLEIETDIEVGHPAEHIVHRAEQLHTALIIMGRRGISSFQRWLLGSVSERVLRYCPVMIVH